MPMNVNYHNPVINFVRGWIQHYDHKKYWTYREKVISPAGGVISLVINYLRLVYIKRCDAFNCASLGTDIGRGAQFKSTPKFPHGINGIIVSPNAVIGCNAYIYQQVTIGDDGRGEYNAPTIGDNVVIGAGAKVIGKINIGNNVKIGAGAIVVEDIPDNATVIGPKARIIIK